MNPEIPSSHDRPTVSVSLLLVRLIVGFIFFVHGAQKVFGVFDGPGLAQFASKMDMGPVGYLVAIGECFGGIGLMIGFLSRFSAAANIVIMCGAIQIIHGKNGFFLSDGGFEYNLALIGLLMPILVAGPGALAIGQYLPLPKSARTGRTIVGLE